MAMASVLPSVTTFSGGSTSSCKPPSSLSFLTPPSPSLSSSLASSAAFPRPFLPSRLRAQPPAMSELDTATFEADRLRLDAEARLNMAQVAAAAEDGPALSIKEGEASTSDLTKNGDTAAGTEDKEEEGAWKWRIRKHIWDLMERENIAVHPRPVHHRIPNFVGAATAAAKLASLPAFQSAKCVKVNPDTPQKQVRYLTLEGSKKLLTPQPRLRSGFFSELEAPPLPSTAIAEACTAVGVAKYGKPLGLDAKLKVDLLVIGSVAVNPKTGARLGKGEGFAELEYAMLRHMGAIDDSTLVVTSVHDKQLVDDIPTEKLKVHDVPVDVICTPTHIIHTKTTISKPKGIYWELLSPEKLGQILVLRELKKKIEKESGQKLPQGPSEKLPPSAQRAPRKGPVTSEKLRSAATKQPVASEKGASTAEEEPKKQQPVVSGEQTSTVKQGPKKQQPVVSEKANSTVEQGPIKQELVTSETGSNEPCIFVWNLDIATTWKELREHVSNAGAEVVKVNVMRKGNTRPMARVLLKDGADIEAYVKALDSSQLGGQTIRAKISSVRERASASSQVPEENNGAKADSGAEEVQEKVPNTATS